MILKIQYQELIHIYKIILTYYICILNLLFSESENKIYQ
jgi:hypothetical protein